MDDLALGAHGRRGLVRGTGGRAGGHGLSVLVIFLQVIGHFRQSHGTVVELAHGENDHHHYRENGVEVIGNGLHKELQPVGAVHKARDSGGPGGDGGDDADRGGGGVDEVGQLRPGDAVPVGQRLHHGAHGQAVEVVVDEDEHTQDDGRELGADLGFHVLHRPAAKGRGAAGPVHQHDHTAENDEEDQDADVPGVSQGTHHAVHKDVLDGAHQIEAGVQQTAGQNADEQGGVYLLGDESQRDRYDRRQQRQKAGIHKKIPPIIIFMRLPGAVTPAPTRNTDQKNGPL